LQNETGKEPVRTGGFKKKVTSLDDEIRILHEAYQFLLRKYKLGEQLQNEVKVQEDKPIAKPATRKPSVHIDEEPEPNPNEEENEEEGEDSIFPDLPEMLRQSETDHGDEDTGEVFDKANKPSLSDDEEFVRSAKLGPAGSTRRKTKSFRR
jgi:hypothetical protein